MLKNRFCTTLLSSISLLFLASCGRTNPDPKFFSFIWKGEQGASYSPKYSTFEEAEIYLDKTLSFYLNNGNAPQMLGEDLMHSMSIAFKNDTEKYIYFSVIKNIDVNRLSFSLHIYDEKLTDVFLKLDVRNLIYNSSIISNKYGEEELVFMPVGIGFDGLSFIIQDDFWNDMLWSISISECNEGKIVDQITINWEFAFSPITIDLLEYNLQNLVIYPHFFSETKIIE